MNEHESAGVVDKDIELRRQNGVHVTPTFFVNGVVYTGTKDATQLQAILEAARHGDAWPVSVSHPQVKVSSVTTSQIGQSR